MPKYLYNESGDGVTADYLQSRVVVTEAGSITAYVTIQRAGIDVAPLILGQFTAPAPARPGSGSTFYSFVVPLAGGLPSILTDPASPPPADVGSYLVYSSVVSAGDPADYTLAPSNTPDTW